MKFNQITEGIKSGDLASLIKNKVSIGEFEPKTGTVDEITVVGFYADDTAPAQDLSQFLERSHIKTLDTEVSRNPDEEGWYMVFIEIENDDNLMNIVLEILEEVNRLTDISEWTLEFYSGKTIKVNEKQIAEWLKKT